MTELRDRAAPRRPGGAATPRIGIVGAGFGGLAMAFELERAGIRTFEVFEKAGRIGGVWRENTYPGAGCDVPAPFYSFSHAPNPGWPQRFSLQQPILEYMERCIREYGIEDRLRLSAEVTRASFDEERRVWRLTVNGQQHVVDVLLCACGQLSVPAWPRVEGLDAFRGRAFHSAQWNEDHDLTGERVAVIGTGASSIQIIPRIAPIVERLYVYRRSAPYVVPKPERTYSARHHRLFRRFPFLLRAERLTAYLSTELLQLGITSRPALLRPWVATWRFNMHRAVRDDAKRAALTPDYDPGCKRVLFSSDYYPAMARDNVEIIPAGVSALTATGVVSDSGELREVDAVIFATGFQAQRFVAPMRIHGRAGLELADAWADGARAYLGMSVPDFPNLFLLYGPNTNVGGGSMIYMLESSARYIVEALKVLATRPGSALELRPEILERYDAEIQDRLSRTAWQSGCHSWYIDDRGRHANNWPGLQREYRRRTRRFEPGHYHLLGDGTPDARAGETSAAVAP